MPSERFLFNGTFFVEDSANTGPYGQLRLDQLSLHVQLHVCPDEVLALDGRVRELRPEPHPEHQHRHAHRRSTAPWTYESKSDVFNVGTTYKLSPKVILNGNFEYVRGLDVVTNTPAPPGAVVPFNLGQYSVVSNITYRISAGVDYFVRPNLTTFFRYNYFDYGDSVVVLQHLGHRHMFLVGVNAMF